MVFFFSEPLHKKCELKTYAILSRCDHEGKRSLGNHQSVHKNLYVPFGVHQSLRAIYIGSCVYSFIFLHLFVVVSVSMGKSEDNLRASILSFNHAGSKD